MPTHKIKLSVASFNELGAALEARGLKFGENVKELIIEKGDELERPIDYRQATMRRDAGNIAARTYTNMPNFIELMNEIYEYILNGTIKSTKDKSEEEVILTTVDRVTGETVTAKWK